MGRSSSLCIIAKNARVNSELRLTHFLSEIARLDWDIVLFSEARAKTIDCKLHDNHRFISFLQDTKSAGVAIAIHSKHCKSIKKIHRVSERVLGIDIAFSSRLCRFIAVYAPHAGYSAEDLDCWYEHLESLLDDALKQNLPTILGGDFNACIDAGIRGQYLRECASRFCLDFANFTGSGCDELNWTFCSFMGVKRRIDYILSSRHWDQISYVSDSQLHLGSDHRAVRCTASLQGGQRPRRQKKKKSLRGWTPASLDDDGRAVDYHNLLDAHLNGEAFESAASIEHTVRACAELCGNGIVGPVNELKPYKQEIVKRLIAARRDTRNTDARKQISKQLFRETRRAYRKWRTQWAHLLLSRYRDVKTFHRSTADMSDQKQCAIDPSILARFLQDIYASDNAQPHRADDLIASIPLFTPADFSLAVRHMANLRCEDEDGIVIEMIKHGSPKLHTVILDYFNRLLRGLDLDPSWHETVFNMLPKSGDLSDASNWRPIAILPILYKIFSKLLYNRIAPLLLSNQDGDQIGFTPGVRIDDAFASIESLIENCHEFQLPLWIFSLDLRKAFDRVEYTSLFEALREAALPEGYIALLSKLYSSQTGRVKDETFPISRGVKQGDVISSVLFNCVIEMAFRRWKLRLWDHGWLLDSNSPRFTNIRYADDVLVAAKSLEELSEMMETLVDELQRIGLQMNASKSKILTNDESNSIAFVDIANNLVEILNSDSDAHRYLGRQLRLSHESRIQVEINNRCKLAWYSLHRNRHLILNSEISTSLRVKYFDAVITPTILFGLATLPLTATQQKRIWAIQRKMLRKLVGWRRIADEPWQDTMRRMKYRVEHAQRGYFVESWELRWKRNQWRYAVHLANLPGSSWAKLHVLYHPPSIDDLSMDSVPHRAPGRPALRWHDALRRFCSTYLQRDDWLEAVREHPYLEDEFCNFS